MRSAQVWGHEIGVVQVSECGARPGSTGVTVTTGGLPTTVSIVTPGFHHQPRADRFHLLRCQFFDAGRSSADEAHGADHARFTAGLSGVWVVAEHVLFVEADDERG